MKTIHLLKEFFSGHILKLAVLAIVFFAVLFYLLQVIGSYLYQTESVRFLEEYGTGADYSYTFIFIDSEANEEKLEKLKGFPGVSYVLYEEHAVVSDGNESYTIIHYTEEMQKYMPITLKSGSWDDETDSESISLVAPEYLAKGEAGFNFISEDGTSEVSAKITGTIDSTCTYFAFDSSSSNTVADTIVWHIDTYLAGDEAFKQLSSYGVVEIKNRFYVFYESDATEEEKENVRAYMSDSGYYVSVSDVIDNTWEQLEPVLKQQVLIPAFCAGVAVIAYIVIQILLLYQKLQEYSLYYLCGAKKRTLISVSTLGMGMVSLIPAVINMVWLLWYENFKATLPAGYQTMLFPASVYLVIIGIWLLILLLVFVTTYSMLYKVNPAEFYRRMQQ